jgi:nucleoside-diphosphate-sugar epimerase
MCIPLLIFSKIEIAASQNDLIKPAVDGTLNVLRACTKAKTVKRVLVTSSGAALMINELEEHNHDIDETCWTDVDLVRKKMSPGKVDTEVPTTVEILKRYRVSQLLMWC